MCIVCLNLSLKGIIPCLLLIKTAPVHTDQRRHLKGEMEILNTETADVT
jgi:hypothetical protein